MIVGDTCHIMPYKVLVLSASEQQIEKYKESNCFRSAMEFIVFHYDHATETEESYVVHFEAVIPEVAQFDSSTNNMWNMIFCNNC